MQKRPVILRSLKIFKERTNRNHPIAHVCWQLVKTNATQHRTNTTTYKNAYTTHTHRYTYTRTHTHTLLVIGGNPCTTYKHKYTPTYKHTNTLHTHTHTIGWRNTMLQHKLQHTATHCNALQHTAIHCNTLQQGVSRPVKKCNIKYFTFAKEPYENRDLMNEPLPLIYSGTRP